MTAVFALVTGIQGLVSVHRFKAGFLVFVFLYGAYPRFFALGVAEQGFALTAQRAMIVVMFFLYMIRWLYGCDDIRRGVDRLVRNKTIVLLLAAILLSKLLGNVATGRFDIGVAATLTTNMLFTIFVVMLTVTCIKSRNGIYLVMFMIVLSLLVNLFAILIEYINGESLFKDAVQIDYADSGIKSTEAILEGAERGARYRVMGFFDNSLEFVSFICPCIPIAVALFLATRERLVRVLTAMTVLIALPAMVWTGSRTVVLGMGSILLIASYRFFCRRLSRRGRIIFTLVGLVAFMLLLYGSWDWFAAKLLSPDRLYARSSLQRVVQHVSAGVLIMQSPFFGFGYARNIADLVDIKPLDSYYLRIMMEGGLVALVSFFALMAVVISKLSRISRLAIEKADMYLAEGLLLSVVSIIAMTPVITYVHPSFYLYLIIGMTLVLSNGVGTKAAFINEKSARQQYAGDVSKA